MKAGIWWMPIDKHGKLWIRWAWPKRKEVIEELNNGHVSWREAGLKVIKVAIRPQPPKRGAPRAK